MRMACGLPVAGALLLVALLVPIGAEARPPTAPVPLALPAGTVAPTAPVVGARVVVSTLSPAPAAARPGRAYVLAGGLVNEGSTAARGRIVVHLLRVGTSPMAIGGTPFHLDAHASVGYRVRVRLPRRLPRESYALVACARRGGTSGTLSCVTAERHLQIGRPTRGAGVRVVAGAAAKCSSGAHSLSPFGAHVYPETGNGGYVSSHTDVFLSYDTESNRFLPGTHVVLTQQATQCLTDFSVDFERTSPNTKDGPDLTVGSVLVNGTPASFTFVQPTYPGDPNGQNDPDPRAHEAGELNPVGGPENNPFPPACTPELMSTNPNKQFDLDGTQCPANKLVITPSSPIPSGATFVVRVDYTGRPGVHNDGDGTTEGWFRVDHPGDTGGFVTTEPVASEDWMPLNDPPEREADV
jgi:hypothetical protein